VAIKEKRMNCCNNLFLIPLNSGL